MILLHLHKRGAWLLFLRKSQLVANGLELGIHGRRERLVITKLTEDAGAMVLKVREIEACEFTAKLVSRVIVCQSCFLCGVEGSQPEAGSVLGESDFRHPLPPVSLPNTAVKLCGFGWGGGHVLHGDPLWGKVLLVAVLDTCGRHKLLLLKLAKLKLRLDLDDLCWGEFVEAYGGRG